jgi:Spy/CpxP family protein refolding chaperone
MVVALCAGVAAMPALSQPGEHHRHHEGGRSGLASAIVALKSQLNLTAAQEAMLDQAIAAGKSARDAARQSRQTVRQLVHDELAKPTPDLARIAAAEDQVQDAATAARRNVRNQLLQLYATFTPAQIAVVKDAMTQRLSRFEAFREHMRERFGKH